LSILNQQEQILEEAFLDHEQPSSQILSVLNNTLDGLSPLNHMDLTHLEGKNMVIKPLVMEQILEQTLLEELANMLQRKVFQRRPLALELELVSWVELLWVLLELWQHTVSTIATMLSDK